MGDDWEIGKAGNLIWRIPEDMRHFKKLTMGHPIIMGRKTRESLPKALPGRTNIVITRQPDYEAPDTLVAHSLEEALRLAENSEGSERIFIIGGGEIYREAFPMLEAIEVTHVYESCPDADTFFPPFTPRTWDLIHMDDPVYSKDGILYGFESYRRYRPDSEDQAPA